MDTELVETDRTNFIGDDGPEDLAELNASVKELIKIVHQQNEILQEQQQQFGKIVRYFKKQTGRPAGKGLIGRIKGMISGH